MSSSAAAISFPSGGETATQIVVRRRMDVVTPGSDGADTVMSEGPTTANVPKWFAELLEQVRAHLDQMEGLVRECQGRSMSIQGQFPELAKAYEDVLENHNYLNDLALKGRVEIDRQRADLAELRRASNQFAAYVE